MVQQAELIRGPRHRAGVLTQSAECNGAAHRLKAPCLQTRHTETCDKIAGSTRMLGLQRHTSPSGQVEVVSGVFAVARVSTRRVALISAIAPIGSTTVSRRGLGGVHDPLHSR